MNTLKALAFVAPAVALAACTSSSAVRTSANTAIIQTSAAPVCGSTGAAKVAQMQAAIETIKAGYDRYIIVDARSANNVQMAQTPGSYKTSGYINNGHYSGTTTYQPGIPVIYGRHEQAFAIYMFRDGEAGAQRAIPARQTLGPKWQEMVKSGKINTCA
ncbi:hypothetical protein [Brucella grignonensis]|uniref:hypothetical protein n=1 Tax=Brucella grignonensis TaxID=94627 RepID=UPI000B9921B1|nr:hypothetical protein [Brucella grignonensis]